MPLSIRNFGYADRQPAYDTKAAKETMDTLMGELTKEQRLALCQQIEENVIVAVEGFDAEILEAMYEYLKRNGLWEEYKKGAGPRPGPRNFWRAS